MRDIRVTLRDREAEDGEPTLRPLRPGDVGWIIHRQAVLYEENTAGTGPTKGSSATSWAISSPNSMPQTKTAGSPSAAAKSSARFSWSKATIRRCQTQAALCRAERSRGRRRTPAGQHCIARARALGYRELTFGLTTSWSPRAASIKRRGFALSTKRRIIRSATTSSGRPGRSIWLKRGSG